MSTINPALGRALAGLGGALLVASLFLPWSELHGQTQTGFETLAVWDLFVLITGVCGLVAALTGGRFGFFRADLSFNGMTDIFGVVVGQPADLVRRRRLPRGRGSASPASISPSPPPGSWRPARATSACARSSRLARRQTEPPAAQRRTPSRFVAAV